MIVNENLINIKNSNVLNVLVKICFSRKIIFYEIIPFKKRL